MKRLVYLSSADIAIEQSDLDDILATANSRNEDNQVTGLLLYNGFNFLQVLEGAPDAVDAIYESITKDQRHHGIVTMLDEKISSRSFEGWSMEFKKIGPADAKSSNKDDATKDLYNQLPEDLPPHVKKLIQGFGALKS